MTITWPVKVRTHLAVRGRPACGQHQGHRLSARRIRVDCKRCMRTAQWTTPPPGVQAMTRMARDGGVVIESPIIQYRAEVGEFIYIGPLMPALDLVMATRTIWCDTSPEGVWVVAFCEDYPGEVYLEWGKGSSYEEATRFAIAAFLSEGQEWVLCEEVMWSWSVASSA